MKTLIEKLSLPQRNALRFAGHSSGTLRTANAQDGFRTKRDPDKLAPGTRDMLVRLGLIEPVPEVRWQFRITDLGREALAQIPAEMEEVEDFKVRYRPREPGERGR